jgi:hypothetical protein
MHRARPRRRFIGQVETRQMPYQGTLEPFGGLTRIDKAEFKLDERFGLLARIESVRPFGFCCTVFE